MIKETNIKRATRLLKEQLKINKHKIKVAKKNHQLDTIKDLNEWNSIYKKMIRILKNMNKEE